ncbi:hypothetical protein ACNKHM_22920 [Shigella sonnei]
MKYDAEPGKFNVFIGTYSARVKKAEFEVVVIFDVCRPDKAFTPHPEVNAGKICPLSIYLILQLNPVRKGTPSLSTMLFS